jgi:hypothetical protein
MPGSLAAVAARAFICPTISLRPAGRNSGIRRSSFPVPPMIRVERPAEDVATLPRVVLAELLVSSFLVVAALAHRHQAIERRERIAAAIDRLHMVDGDRGLDAADLDAEFAQRFFSQLRAT